MVNIFLITVKVVLLDTYRDTKMLVYNAYYNII